MELKDKKINLQWLADDLVEKLKADQIQKMVLANCGDQSVLKEDYTDNMKIWVESMYDSI